MWVKSFFQFWTLELDATGFNGTACNKYTIGVERGWILTPASTECADETPHYTGKLYVVNLGNHEQSRSLIYTCTMQFVLRQSLHSRVQGRGP
jgi:hypothetical protein